MIVINLNSPRADKSDNSSLVINLYSVSNRNFLSIISKFSQRQRHSILLVPYIKLTRNQSAFNFSSATLSASGFVLYPIMSSVDAIADIVLITWYLETSPIHPTRNTLPLRSPNPPATRTLNFSDKVPLNVLSSNP